MCIINLIVCTNVCANSRARSKWREKQPNWTICPIATDVYCGVGVVGGVGVVRVRTLAWCALASPMRVDAGVGTIVCLTTWRPSGDVVHAYVVRSPCECKYQAQVHDTLSQFHSELIETTVDLSL